MPEILFAFKNKLHAQAKRHLSGSIALVRGIVESDVEKFETDLGYGINVAIGKEWWVSDNWGIGVAGQLFYTVLPDENPKGEEFDLNTASIGILFTATFN